MPGVTTTFTVSSQLIYLFILKPSTTFYDLAYTLQVAQVRAKLRERDRVVQENLIEICASVSESSFIVKYCFVNDFTVAFSRVATKLVV